VKHYKILDEATAELEAAATWYEQQRDRLGLELVGEFRERLALALEMPGTGVIAGYTAAQSEIRRFRRFKRYAILLATVRGEPTVLAFEHANRRPDYWRDRL
jgi:plasmid stabilization system protein ParE